MDETLGAGEVQEAETSSQGFLSSEEIGHCSNGGMGLLSTVTFSATPVLRIAAATNVAGDPSEGGWGGAVDPQCKRDSFCNITTLVLILAMQAGLRKE